MNNGSRVGGAELGIVSSAWRFAGVGDYAGNGTTDILWRNSVTGEVDTWLVKNDSLAGGSAVGFVSSGWQPQLIHSP